MRCSILFLLLAAGAPALAQQAPGPASREDIPKDLSLYTEASLRMHQQRHAEALRLLDRLLKDHPKSPMSAGAQFFRAQCLEELGRRDTARQAYQLLIQAHAASGWARDAKRRVGLLSRSTPAAPVTPATPVKTGKLARLVLTNGDTLSGRIVERAGEVYELQLSGVGHTVRVPKARVVSVSSGRPSMVSLGGSVSGSLSFALPSTRRDAIVALLNDDEEVEQDDGVKTTTRTNKDGSKTITKVYPDGTKVETTVTKQGKNRRVTVVRERKGDKKHKHKVELKFALDDEDEKDLELQLEALKDLPKKLRLKLKNQLKGLEDLDFDLELEELQELEKDLDKLPERIRKRIKKSFRTPRRKVRKVFRWKGKNGEQEEEFMFTPKGSAPFGGPKIRKRVIVKGLPGGGGNVWIDHGGNDFTAHGLDHSGSSLDRVYLRNGDKISGKLLSVDAEQVRVKASYGEVTIKRDQVRQITFARVPKPYLGVSMSPVKNGVKLSQVFKASPAEAAGLKSGDVITSVDGKAIRSAGDLGKAIKGKKVGQTLKLAVQRGEQSLTIEAKLGTKPSGGWGFDGARGYRFMQRVPRPPRAPRAPRAPMLREHQRKLHEHQRSLRDKHRAKALEQARKAREQARKARRRARELREKDRSSRPGRPFLGIGLSTVDGGAKVTSVTPNSTAAAIGLQAGDVITHWNGKLVKSAADLREAIRAGKIGDRTSLRAKRGDGGVVEMKFRLGSKARPAPLRPLRPMRPAPPAPPAPPADGGVTAPPKARDF